MTVFSPVLLTRKLSAYVLYRRRVACDEPGLLTRAKILVLMHVVGQVDDVELRRVRARK